MNTTGAALQFQLKMGLTHVQIKGGVGGMFLGATGDSSLVWGTMIQGNLQAEENSNALISLSNVVGGDLQVFKNTGV